MSYTSIDGRSIRPFFYLQRVISVKSHHFCLHILSLFAQKTKKFPKLKNRVSNLEKKRDKYIDIRIIT